MRPMEAIGSDVQYLVMAASGWYPGSFSILSALKMDHAEGDCLYGAY